MKTLDGKIGEIEAKPEDAIRAAFEYVLKEVMATMDMMIATGQCSAFHVQGFAQAPNGQTFLIDITAVPPESGTNNGKGH